MTPFICMKILLSFNILYKRIKIENVSHYDIFKNKFLEITKHDLVKKILYIYFLMNTKNSECFFLCSNFAYLSQRKIPKTMDVNKLSFSTNV